MTSLRALLVEDNPIDAELIVAQLKRAGFAAATRRVETETDLKRALAEEWDVILSDFELPQFDGLSALAVVREQAPDVPFILVSGAIGESLAVEVMKRGALDCVFKERLQEIGTAVRRALENRRLTRENRKARHALELSEARFRLLTQNIEQIFWIAEPDTGAVRYVSPAYDKIFGRSLGDLAPDCSWPPHVHPEDRERVQAAIEKCRRAGANQHEYRIQRPSKEARLLSERVVAVRDATGKLESLVGVADDVTDARQMEEYSRQAQKMEGIGQLAGGVAHDFNNLLGVILGSSSEGLLEPNISEQQRETLMEIQNAAEHGATLTRQLLVFSRRETVHREDVDLNRIVSDFGKVLQRLLREDIELEIDLSPGALPIHADSGMIEQVLVNLAVNARDAMPEGGSLHIVTGCKQVTIPAPGDRQAPHNPVAVLSVRDTGNGIPLDVRDRIFEPFFTTKGPGEGTGLGLATIYGIVQRHDGWVNFESEPGRGTTFFVFFPLVEHTGLNDSKDTSLQSARLRPALETPKTLLIVEDDPHLRRVVERILSKLGYGVLVAADGQSAIEQWDEHGASIDLLLTDLVMPGAMNGWDLAHRLRCQKPDLPVVYTSGYGYETLGQQADCPGDRFLAKPFSAAKLVDIIHDCLCRTQPVTANDGARHFERHN